MSAAGYAEAKQRLDEILEAVSDEGLPLDDALALYEEAVGLGMKVSGLIETDISEHEAQMAAEAAAEAAAEQVAEQAAGAAVE